MFRYPLAFLALIPGFFILTLGLLKIRPYPAPGGESWKLLGRSLRARFWWTAEALDALILLVLAFLLAGPQAPISPQEVSGRGLNLAVVLDRSGSMGALVKMGNGEESRFDGVKTVLRDFFQRRQDDAVTLISFARNPETHTPLSSNPDVLTGFLDLIPLATETSETGTNIGDALVLALGRLTNGQSLGEAAPGAIILMTDGKSNLGDSTPEEAARMASALGIRIYAIGLGGVGYFKTGGLGEAGQVDLDVKTLTSIAQSTGGQYFQANNSSELGELFRSLEATALPELRQLKNPPRTLDLIPALVLLGMLILLRPWFRYRVICRGAL